MADDVAGREGQPAQGRLGGRQHGPDLQLAVWIDPRQLLTFHAARLALPSCDLAEGQAHDVLGVLVHIGDPGRGCGDLDIELFLQLARQGFQYRFTRFDLAAGQLPPAGPRLVGRTLAQQQAPIRSENDACGYVEEGFRHDAPPSRVRIAERRARNAIRAPAPTGALRCARLRSIRRYSPSHAASGSRYPGSRPA